MASFKAMSKNKTINSEHAVDTTASSGGIAAGGSPENNGQEVIILCNMGYDYDGKKIKPVQKSVIVPDDVIPAIWLSEQAKIFENEVKARQTEPMPLALFIIMYRNSIGENINNKDIERICSRLGEAEIKEVTPQMLEEFHERIIAETTLQFTAREHLHRVLCEIFRVATELGYITINPTFRTFRYERKEPPKRETVYIKSIRKLLKCLEYENPKHRLFYSLIISTGLNRVEVTQLKWSDIDFKGKAIKGIPLTASIMKQLNNQKQDDGYIFAQPNGKAMCPSSFTYRLNLLRKKHNLDGITMHKIQNTVAELLKTMSHIEIQRKVGL